MKSRVQKTERDVDREEKKREKQMKERMVVRRDEKVRRDGGEDRSASKSWKEEKRERARESRR